MGRPNMHCPRHTATASGRGRRCAAAAGRGSGSSRLARHLGCRQCRSSQARACARCVFIIQAFFCENT